MNTKQIYIFAVLALVIFALGAQLATAQPVELLIGNTEISFLPLIITSNAQSLPEEGVAKAGVFADCSDTTSDIINSFNNVNDEEITISNGSSDGECNIDFGFSVDSHYVLATANSDFGSIGVSVVVGGSNVYFYVWDASDYGTGFDGLIYVVVY